MSIVVCKIFLDFMPFIGLLIVKYSHILAGNYFIFRKQRPRPDLKVLQHQIWISVKRLKMYLSCKANFSTFL